tara:strand:- start:150 stop:302 length:153 start_codon:yes stop_codon:yes gene_type:complete
MIRFWIGLLLLMGCAGGLEQETVNSAQLFLGISIGMILMVTGTIKINKQY